MSKIGLGTAAIGRPAYININQSESGDQESAFNYEDFKRKGLLVLDAAYRQGVRYFDTAPGYGMAEEMLLEWLEDKEDPTIQVASKWGYTYVAGFLRNPKQHEIKEHSLAKLREQWTTTQRFSSALINYQIHSATFETGVLKNLQVLNELAALKEQYDLQIGITTTGHNQIEVLKSALDVEVKGIPLFTVYQVTYNVFDQSFAPVAPEVMARGGKLIIKEAMANGRVFRNQSYPHYNQAFDTLELMAKKYHVAPDAIAIRFCLDSIPISKVLSGANNTEHLASNLKANTFTLDESDLAALKALVVSPIHYWNERKQLGWT